MEDDLINAFVNKLRELIIFHCENSNILKYMVADGLNVVRLTLSYLNGSRFTCLNLLPDVIN